MKVPQDILAYFNGESEELADLPLEAEDSEVSGSRFMQAISRTFSSLSPKKRRMRRLSELERSQDERPEASLEAPASPRRGLLSPKKRPSLAIASPAGTKTRPSLAAASPAGLSTAPAEAEVPDYRCPDC